MNHSDVIKLEAITGSPFYVVDRQTFEANFEDLSNTFQSRYSPFILAYSYKTNYLPYLCQIIKEKGGWAEVVSRMEYDLALKIGCNPKKIIFNGPVKTTEDIMFAMNNGTLVNIDSETELDLITKYAKSHPNKPVSVGLRINIGLSDETGRSRIQNSLKVGRFGLDPKHIESSIINYQSSMQGNNLKIISLHGHTSTTDRSPWCFQVITKTLCEIAQTHFPESVKYLNVGGGFFGRMHPDMPFRNTPSFDEYADVVCKTLNDNPWVKQKNPTLVIEPGVAMVANAVSFFTKVVSVKSIRDKTFVTVDGSAFNTKPTFHSINMPHQVILQDRNNPVQSYDVVGSTCMEKDIILKEIADPLPQPGDFIVIENVGAYTLVMTPSFINPAPAILANEKGTYKLVRKKRTLDEIFSNYIF